jgi:hypothetical protein
MDRIYRMNAITDFKFEVSNHQSFILYILSIHVNYSYRDANRSHYFTP